MLVGLRRTTRPQNTDFHTGLQEKMLDLDTLNPQQKEAVCHFRGPMMILAGAGTGKTRVVTSRIAYMLANGVAAKNIAAMTFTNKAAKEMRDRIAKLVGSRQAQDLSIGTFHSFCLKILRSWPKAAGLPAKFSLLGTSDQLDLVRRALEDKGWQGLYRPDLLHYQIGQCKNWLITADDLAQGQLPPCGVQDPQVLVTMYQLYERQLGLNRAIDFDDCILKVIQLLRSQEALTQKLQERYRYLLVDEFQDTNASQFAVLELLAGAHGNICVVGDDDQSIYSWRGAMYETLERFEKTFAHSRMIKLEQNYRCSNVILAAANHLIKFNTRRKAKTLWSQSQDDKPIALSIFAEASDEARWVALQCLSLLGRGYRLQDIAILYRANAQSKLLEMALRECNLGYKTYGGQSFFERKEVKDFLAYLRLVANPDDPMALWRVINTPNRGIGLKTQEEIAAQALARQCAPLEVMRSPTSYLSPTASKAISSFIAMIDELTALPLSSPETCRQLGEEIIRRTGLGEHIKMNSKNLMARQHKLNSLMSLPAWLEKAAETALSAERASSVDMFGLLDALTLNDEQKFSGKEEKSDHISLMTIHAAKGLEFPAVFIVGLEDGSLPHKNSLETAEALCEERRLLYVALTRAKKELFLSYAHLRQTGFQKEERLKSRFLQELPRDEGIVRLAEEAALPSPQKEQENKKQTLAKFASIREQLQKGSWD